MSLLSLVDKFTKRTLAMPTLSVLGSNDNQIMQIMTLLEEEGNDLAQRHTWQALAHETTLTTIADEDQGHIDTIAPNGFRFIKNNTIWDRTDTLPVIGPISDKAWQALKAIPINGPRYQFRFRGNHLISNPAPTAGHTWAFEYQSNNWILDPNGSTTKSEFSSDNDTFLLPESILLLGLRWRWAREKGLSYSELFQSYEMQIKDAMGRDGGKPNLFMDYEGNGYGPGTFVPAGNWAIP